MDDELRVNPRTPRHHFLVFFSPHSFAFGEVNMCVYACEINCTWSQLVHGGLVAVHSKYPMNWYERA
jgi:hypothetical protein